MSERLKTLVKTLSERSAFPIYGAHIAAGYLLTVDPIIRGKQLVTDFGLIGTVETWEKSLEAAKDRLVWMPAEQETTVLTGEELTKARSDSAYVETMQTGSIFDAITVLTSKKQDRDGDVMDPDGADIDKKMPWLWQHIQSAPIGKYVRTVAQDKEYCKVHYALCDIMLARDAATLSAFGALRTSHGFMPKEWEELPAGKGRTQNGWHFTKYLVYEGSSVSIPSNTDAELTAFHQEKLFHPLVKAHAAGLDAKRPKTVTLSGAGIGNETGLKLTVEVVHKNAPAADSPTAAATPALPAPAAGEKGLGGGPLEGSWEETTAKLQASVKSHLMGAGVDVRSGDYCWVLAMFDKAAVVCHQFYKGSGDGYSSNYDTCIYRCKWKNDGDEPIWDGAPKEVKVQTQLVEVAKAAMAAAVSDRLKMATVDELGRLLLSKTLHAKEMSWPLGKAVREALENLEKSHRESEEERLAEQQKAAEENFWHRLFQ